MGGLSHRGLRRNHPSPLDFLVFVSVSVFAKLTPLGLNTQTTRVLAEERFMKRALIEKIQAGIPLGDATWSIPPGMR